VIYFTYNRIKIFNMSTNKRSNMNTATTLCNNCGKQGHILHQCKLPITSYGIILFRSSAKGLQFLMINRKDSFGYIDFVRGKYSVYNVNHTQSIIDEMSNIEKSKVISQPFTLLWKNMWGDILNAQKYRSEESSSGKKFEQITNGVLVEGEKFDLKYLVNKSTTNWLETEWEFPKGRRNFEEKDLDCALREFEEETGINRSFIDIIENVLPFEEIFIGTNHKSYKHKYFLAYINEVNNEVTLQNYQTSEVSKLEWKTTEDCLESIRPYNLEKKQLISNINKVLEEYRLYS
jgi:8-oxo-dGTP pyrophosphatase MutT (NUDIX family)